MLVHEGAVVPLRVDGTRSTPWSAAPPDVPVLERGAVRWSLAYGSNADPERLIDKGLDRRGAVLLPASVVGLRRAWEARRTSSTGAVPLTLVAAPGERLDTWVLGVHSDDCDALDRTEGRGGNYLLGRVGPVAVADRFLLPDALAYGPSSTTALITVEARPAAYPDLDQQAAGVLADDDTTATLAAEPLSGTHEGPWPETPFADLPLLVYGTQRPGERYWPRVADLVEVVGDASCAGSVVETRFGWPAADLSGIGRFEGVLLEPRDASAARELVAVTDEIEGVPSLFRRRAVPVEVAGGDRWAIVYEWAPGQGPPPT